MLRLHVEQAIMPKTIVILRASDGAMQFRCLIIRCPLQRMAMEEEPGIVSPVI
jgi:hypothetical protein